MNKICGSTIDFLVGDHFSVKFSLQEAKNKESI